MTAIVRLPADRLVEFCTRLLAASGAGDDEACQVSNSLVLANLCGHDSHGVFRVVDYVSQIRQGHLTPGAPLTILDEGPSRVLADGGRGFGQIQCRKLLELLLSRARAEGLACGAMRQSGHVGRLGEWVELAAEAGFAALLAVNDNGVPQTVAPPGGLTGRLSTNPLAIAVPTTTHPLVLDFSTSAVANGKVTVARQAGQQVPLGWLQDASGQPTTDPGVLKAQPPGALLPFGGEQAYKAFGLAVVLDVLISGLSGGVCPPAPDGTIELNNVLMLVWDPSRWSGQTHFVDESSRFVDHLRSTPVRPGAHLRLPGDRSRDCRSRRQRDGIELPWQTVEQLNGLAQDLGVSPMAVC